MEGKVDWQIKRRNVKAEKKMIERVRDVYGKVRISHSKDAN